MTPTLPSTSARPHPQLNIPQGARRPEIVSPQRTSWASYSFELNGQAHDSSDTFYQSTDDYDHTTPVNRLPIASPEQDSSRLYTNIYYPDAQRPRSTSSFSPQNAVYAFPEPHIQHTPSVQASPGPYGGRPSIQGHRQSKSDVGPIPPADSSPYSSVASFSSSSFAPDVRHSACSLGHTILTVTICFPSAIYGSYIGRVRCC